MVAATGLASANSIMVTCTGGNGNTELGPAANGTVNCAGDGGFGINPLWITSIEITINGAVISPSSITLINNDNQAHTFSGTTDVAYNLDAGSSLPGVTLPVDGQGNIFDVFAGTGNQNLAACSSFVSPGPCTSPAGAMVTVSVTGNANSGALSVGAANFAHYESAFSFAVDTNTALSINFHGGNGSDSQATFASVGAVVQYDYTIPSGTPEPTTMALMGGALLGLGLIGKRFRKS